MRWLSLVGAYWCSFKIKSSVSLLWLYTWETGLSTNSLQLVCNSSWAFGGRAHTGAESPQAKQREKCCLSTTQLVPLSCRGVHTVQGHATNDWCALGIAWASGCLMMQLRTSLPEGAGADGARRAGRPQPEPDVHNRPLTGAHPDDEAGRQGLVSPPAAGAVPRGRSLENTRVRIVLASMGEVVLPIDANTVPTLVFSRDRPRGNSSCCRRRDQSVTPCLIIWMGPCEGSVVYVRLRLRSCLPGEIPGQLSELPKTSLSWLQWEMADAAGCTIWRPTVCGNLASKGLVLDVWLKVEPASVQQADWAIACFAAVPTSLCLPACHTILCHAHRWTMLPNFEKEIDWAAILG